MSNSSLLLFYTLQRRLHTIHTVKFGPPPREFSCMHFLTKTKIAVALTIIFENKNHFSMLEMHTSSKTFVRNIFLNFEFLVYKKLYLQILFTNCHKLGKRLKSWPFLTFFTWPCLPRGGLILALLEESYIQTPST